VPTHVDDLLVRVASWRILQFVIIPLGLLALLFCVFDHFSPLSSIVFAFQMVTLAATVALYAYLDDRPSLGVLGATSAILAAAWYLVAAHWGLGHALFVYHLLFEGSAWLPFRLVVDMVPPILAIWILGYLITDWCKVDDDSTIAVESGLPT
jgi:hypothetical protein